LPITVKVRDVMDRNLVFMESGAPVSGAVRMMVERNVWSVLVAKNGLPVGVVTVPSHSSLLTAEVARHELRSRDGFRRSSPKGFFTRFRATTHGGREG